MALSEEQIDTLIDKYIMGLYQDLEDEVISDIARRVQKTGRYTETAELMAKSMVEQGYSAEKIQAEVMKTLRADKTYQMAVAENTNYRLPTIICHNVAPDSGWPQLRFVPALLQKCTLYSTRRHRSGCRAPFDKYHRSF